MENFKGIVHPANSTFAIGEVLCSADSEKENKMHNPVRN